MHVLQLYILKTSTQQASHENQKIAYEYNISLVSRTLSVKQLGIQSFTLVKDYDNN